MRSKTISIVLEQMLQSRAVNTPGGGITSEPMPTQYEIVQMRNAVILEWDNKKKLLVGSMLSEQEADSLARCKIFDVTIKK